MKHLKLVGTFSLSYFISYLRFLFYLGSISVLLRGQGAFGWEAMAKTGSRHRGMFFFSFVYPANNHYRYYDSDRQHLHPTLPRQPATASTTIHSKKSTKNGRETFKSTHLLGHKDSKFFSSLFLISLITNVFTATTTQIQHHQYSPPLERRTAVKSAAAGGTKGQTTKQYFVVWPR